MSASKQNLKPRLASYFAGVDICFRKAIMKLKNVYFIHANVDKVEILNIQISKVYFFAIPMRIRTAIFHTRQVSYSLDHKNIYSKCTNFKAFEILNLSFLKVKLQELNAHASHRLQSENTFSRCANLLVIF